MQPGCLALACVVAVVALALPTAAESICFQESEPAPSGGLFTASICASTDGGAAATYDAQFAMPGIPAEHAAGGAGAVDGVSVYSVSPMSAGASASTGPGCITHVCPTERVLVCGWVARTVVCRTIVV